MSTIPEPEVEVANAPASNRYEIHVDGELTGFADYRREEARIIFPHTEIDPAFGGRGLGKRLVEFAVRDARAQGLEIVPLCPFVRDWIEQHPEES